MTKSSVSEPRKRLLHTMQALNFGRIERLHISAGEPVFMPPPRTIQHVKVGGENVSRAEIERDDFLLKAQVIELFGHMDRLQNGTIETLDVKHGLPFAFTVERVL